MDVTSLVLGKKYTDEKAKVVADDLVVLQAEVTTNKIDYATQIDLKLTNKITNGNFSNDNPLIGTTIDTSWGVGDSRSSNLTMTSIGVVRSANQPISGLVVGDKWYLSVIFKLKTSISSGGYYGLRTQGNTMGNLNLNTTDLAINTIKTLTGVRTIISSDIGFYASLYDPLAIATILIDNCIAINLTSTFGVGNEPTKQEMDTLITLLGGWFDGTITPTQKQLANWYLKMIRQNRTAIIALGGTIV